MTKLINLPKISDVRGNLTFIEGNTHIPFKIERVFWIYDVPGGETRGGHAYINTKEFIVALSGSFDVIVDTGSFKTKYNLNRSYNGLLVDAKQWRHMENFSTNAVALVLSSTLFDKKDYIRDYKSFRDQTDYSNILVSNNKIKLPKINAKTTTVTDCKQINLGKVHQEKGNITVVENNIKFKHITNRVYYLYDIPGGQQRGGHAHKALHQLIIAASGSFDVVLYDGEKTKTVRLDRSYNALKIVPGIWRELKNFSSGSICLVLASEKFISEDYIRNFDEFQKFKG